MEEEGDLVEMTVTFTPSDFTSVPEIQADIVKNFDKAWGKRHGMTVDPIYHPEPPQTQ